MDSKYGRQGPGAGIGATLTKLGRRRGSAPALRAEDGDDLSYAALAGAVLAAAAALRAGGVGARTPVGVLLPTGPEAALASLAVMSCAACVPMNVAASDEELAFVIADAGLRHVLTLPELAGRPALQGLQRLTMVRDARDAAGLFSIRLPEGPVAAESGDPPFNDALATCLMIHTSGTTARPKLVPLTHLNVTASARANAKCFGLREDDVCLNVLPLLHVGGLVHTLLSALLAGGTVVCLTGFDPLRFFDQVARFRPSWFSGTPAVQIALLPLLDEYRRKAPGHRFRFLRSASAPLPVAMIEKLESGFGAPMIEGYGMTEAGRICCNPLPPGRRKPGSVGLPVFLEVRVIGADGAPLPPEQTGEVVLRGPSVTPGYVANEAANAAAFVDGWFRTGDLGRFDADGYLYLVGRTKELINRGGKKVAPREIDEVLMTVPGVREAAAFAMPHPTLGEDIGAAVAALPGHVLDATSVRQELLLRMAPHKVPSAIVVVAALPRGTTGKVQRNQLHALLAARLADRGAALATATEHAVAAAFEEVLGTGVGGADDNFFLLGGDSLSAARVLARLGQSIGRSLPVEALFEHPTVAALARYRDGLVATAPGGASAPAGPTPAGSATGTAATIATPPDDHDAARAAMMAEIDSLSDEEVERLLAEQDAADAAAAARGAA